MCRYFIDLVKHMDAHGHEYAVPVTQPGLEARPVMDLQSGYAKRGAKHLPKQGTVAPWRMAMSYQEDAKALRGPVHDQHLEFGRRQPTAVSQDRRPAHV
jgi:hypothetical protein